MTDEIKAIRSIKRAWDESKDPESAIDEISEIWSSLSDVTELAEARMRLLVGQIEQPPELSEVPTWISTQLEELQSNSHVLPSVVKRTRRLLSAAAFHLDDVNVTAEIEERWSGKIHVYWVGLGSSLTWIIAPCEMPWPGIKVKAYTPNPSKPTAIGLHRFYEAGRLISHFRQCLGD